MSPLPPTETNLVLRENNYLKKTISALRDELVNRSFDQEQALQKITTVHEAEKSQLHSTISSLREEMEHKIASFDQEK